LYKTTSVQNHICTKIFKSKCNSRGEEDGGGGEEEEEEELEEEEEEEKEEEKRKKRKRGCYVVRT
jgi:hypothetical protein